MAAGADLVCCSGDKLIGGPQAGVIVGRQSCVARVRKHPLTRMLRVDKATDLAMEQTLRLFLDPGSLIEHHPTLRMMAMDPREVRRRAEALRRRLNRRKVRARIEIRPGESATGGGSLPAVPLPTWLLAVADADVPPQEVLSRLRRHEPPVIARVEQDAVAIDLRTVFEDEEPAVVAAIAAAVGSRPRDAGNGTDPAGTARTGKADHAR